MTSFEQVKVSNLVLEVTESTFQEEVLESKIPVLVVFWSPNCIACKLLDTVVDEVAWQYASVVKFVKVNANENSSLVGKYGIRNVPTLIVFNQAQRVDMIVGAVPKITFNKTLEKYL